MVDIGPIQATNGMTPVTGPRLESVKSAGSVPNNLPVDRVEISPIARLMSEISALPDIRDADLKSWEMLSISNRKMSILPCSISTN